MLEIRAARPTDALALVALNRRFNGETGATATTVAAALLAPGGELVFVAVEGGVLVGFCCAQVKRSMCYLEPHGEITEMYVAPQHRRQGLATGLLACAEQALAALGVREITLLTGDTNMAAQAAYEACGYVRSGEAHYERTIGG